MTMSNGRHQPAIAAAARIRAMMTEDPYEMIDAVRVAEALGLRVQFCTLPDTPGDRDVSSFLHHGCIYVIADQRGVDQRLAIGREIGRHVLHADRIGTKGYNGVSSRRRDHHDTDRVEADLFASHLLTTDSAIRRWTRLPLRYGIHSLSRIVGIPVNVLRSRTDAFKA